MQYRNDGSREEYQIQNQFTAYLQVALRRRKNAYLSVDGGRAIRLSGGDVIRISRSEHCVSLVRITQRSFYQILLSKLGKT